MTATIYHMPCSNTAAERVFNSDRNDALEDAIKMQHARDGLDAVTDIAECLISGRVFINDFKGTTYTSADVDQMVADKGKSAELICAFAAGLPGADKALKDYVKRCALQVAFDALDMDDVWDDLLDLQSWATRTPQ